MKSTSIYDCVMLPPGKVHNRAGNLTVVEGEETTPFVLTATLSDVGNGNSMALDGREWLYVNPDVNLSLHRPLEGEWLGMRSIAHQHPSGIGCADSLIFDESGPIGRVGQSQILEPRTDSATT